MTAQALGGVTSPPALVVISGGASSPARPAAIDEKLLKALPRAQRVLEVGGVGGAMGREYQRLHPGSSWLGVGLDVPDSAPLGARFDLLVISDGLQHVADPLRLLDDLTKLASPQATLVASVANSARLSMLERIVEADLTGTDGGRFSPSSIYKVLMDAGWMPTLADHDPAAPAREPIAAAARAMADALGVPRATAEKTLGIDRLIIESRRTFGDAPAADGAANFTVVVPTTRESQLRLNVESSPGLKEVDARIVSYRKARSPAETLEQSLAHCDRDWVLLCHQDVYFPRSFGVRLNALLSGIAPAQRAETLIGFVGMGVDAEKQTIRPAGFVIDRLHRADHAESNAAVSIDELAIVLSRDSLHRIDPRIGWHLWATELCLASLCTHKVLPRLVCMPLFHNSHNDFTLPQAFYESAAYLAAKYPTFSPIPTLCGPIDERFLASHRSAAR